MTVTQEGGYVVAIRLEADAGIRGISKLREFSRLKRLELAGTRVIPAEIKRLESLVELDLDATTYRTANVANVLAEMPSIRRVMLHGLTLTDEEYDRLQRARPEARFVMLPAPPPPSDVLPVNILGGAGGIGGGGIER